MAGEEPKGPRDVVAAASFPRPVRAFAGRAVELARIAALLVDEVLFLVYGVAGIGKSELVYRAIDDLRRVPAWRDATAPLISIRAGDTMPRVLAQLLEVTGASVAPPRGRSSKSMHIDKQLGALAEALESRPTLLLIDDAHHLPRDATALMLERLSRHVSKSRVFVTSRHEIPLPDGAAPPVVTTLGPLDSDAAEQMMKSLALRLQASQPSLEELLGQTHGSPFHIRQMIARHGPVDDCLEDSLAELSDEARRILMLVSVTQHMPSVAALGRTWHGRPTALKEALRELEYRFLVDVDQGGVRVHDLIRDALMAQAPSRAVIDARAAAVLLSLDRAEDVRDVTGAVEAVSQFLLAGKPAEAWEIVVGWHSRLSAHGVDHLLLDPLEELRHDLPNERVSVDLVRVRCLIRASMIDDAARALAAVPDERSVAEKTRYLSLSGEIAQRRGELLRAESLFGEALQCAIGAQPASPTDFTPGSRSPRRRCSAAPESGRELRWTQRWPSFHRRRRVSEGGVAGCTPRAGCTTSDSKLRLAPRAKVDWHLSVPTVAIWPAGSPCWKPWPASSVTT